MRSSPTFWDTFHELSTSASPLCVGFDPAPELLSAWGLPNSAAGCRAFSFALLDATSDHISIVKLQSAFYEQFGVEGVKCAADLIQEARERGLLVILDCKRGDIGSTNDAYAAAYLKTGAPLEVDAITATAYLGPDALRGAIDIAQEHGKAVFVVVLSSNPEGVAIQNARLEDGRTVAESVADWLSAENNRRGGRTAAAVVGATLGRRAAGVLQRLNSSMILAPGVGTQGGDLGRLAEDFGDAAKRVIPTVSRAVAMVGPDPAAIAMKLHSMKLQFRGITA